VIYFEVINFAQMQHYKDRNPPWIKLYNEILDDYKFSCLQDASKLHHILICLLASRNNNKIPYDAKWIAKRINASEPVNLKALEDAGLIRRINDLEDASDMLADCEQSAMPETETETETETEKKTHCSADAERRENAIEILNFLNRKTGKNFRAVKANLDLITARLKEDYVVVDFHMVIAMKIREWANDPEKRIWLRPKTLFNKTNFAQYQGELVEPEENQNG
jgi:uncharacterized phage protein (TIGR02220 family)